MILHVTLVSIHMTFLLYWLRTLIREKKNHKYYTFWILFNIFFVGWNYYIANKNYKKDMQKHLELYHNTNTHKQ
jgi:hypothetical protein